MNNQQKRKNTAAAAAILILGPVLLAACIAYSVTQGTADISVSTILDSLFRFDSENLKHLIVIDVRIPRVLASALVGAALAVAGAIMQGTTRNPLADSGLLGLNSGAGFALSVCFAFFPSLSYIYIVIISFAGAAFGVTLVNGIATVRYTAAKPMRLVLAGAAVSALLTALSQGIAIYYGVSQDIMFWTVGGVAGTNWLQLKIIAPFILAALAAAVLLSRAVTIMNLGEETAKGLGVNTAVVNLLCSVTVLVLAGTSVAVIGSVGFVGLMVPHIMRFVVGSDYVKIIPCSAVGGALLVVLADLGARMINPPFETPIGAIIACVGVPFFLVLARKQKGVL